MESKKTESTDMNPRKTTIAILTTLFVSLALADDFKTINGKDYKDAIVIRVEPDGVMIKDEIRNDKGLFRRTPERGSTAV